MKTSSPWHLGSIVGKIMMGLVIAAMIGSIGVVQAVAKDDHKREGRHDNGRYEDRGRGYDHDKPVYRPYGYYGPYGYRERVYYPPPPVIYEPPPPPGISIFFPPLYIRP